MLRAKNPIYSKNYNNNNNTRELTQKATRGAGKIFSTICNMSFKKRRYAFQILKQFYLFSDGQSSSITSLSTYDRLIFSDEAIHTLVKKLQTKVLQRKIWAFINLKVLRIIQQVKNAQEKLNKVIVKSQVLLKSSAFSRIRVYSYDYRQIQQSKKVQPVISSYHNISKTITKSPVSSFEKITEIESSTMIISQSHISHVSPIRAQNQIHVHRGSGSRSPSPNSSYTRIITQPQRRGYLQTIRISPGKVKVHEVSPRRSIQVIDRSPNKYQYDVDQVRREYGNHYHIPSRIRIVSCLCRDITVRSCECTNSISRSCGCNNCSHTCFGCNTCNCCHCHCRCSRSCSRSCSREKPIINNQSTIYQNQNQPLRIKQKIILTKSPQKQTKNRYLQHLQNGPSQNRIRSNMSPNNQKVGLNYQYSQTRTTQVRRI